MAAAARGPPGRRPPCTGAGGGTAECGAGRGGEAVPPTPAEHPHPRGQPRARQASPAPLAESRMSGRVRLGGGRETGAAARLAPRPARIPTADNNRDIGRRTGVVGIPSRPARPHPPGRRRARSQQGAWSEGRPLPRPRRPRPLPAEPRSPRTPEIGTDRPDDHPPLRSGTQIRRSPSPITSAGWTPPRTGLQEGPRRLYSRPRAKEGTAVDFSAVVEVELSGTRPALGAVPY